MRRCRDDHDRKFFFHGFFQKFGQPVVIVEDVESHRLTELSITDVTFTNKPPLGPEGVAAMMPPIPEMFGGLRRDNRGLTQTMRDAYNMAGGERVGADVGLAAVRADLPRPEEAILRNQPTQEERPTVEGEFAGAMEEAMPTGGEVEPLGPPEAGAERLVAHHHDEGQVQEEVQRTHGEVIPTGPNAALALGPRPRENDTEAERPAEDPGETEANDTQDAQG